jgi:hypothetical protein
MGGKELWQHEEANLPPCGLFQWIDATIPKGQKRKKRLIVEIFLDFGSGPCTTEPPLSRSTCLKTMFPAGAALALEIPGRVSSSRWSTERFPKQAFSDSQQLLMDVLKGGRSPGRRAPWKAEQPGMAATHQLPCTLP